MSEPEAQATDVITHASLVL